MDFTTAVSRCFSNYVNFSSRAPRSEYWFFALFMFGALIAAIVVDTVLGMIGGGLFYAVSLLALFLPSISVAVRRLHDLDKSGWWYLIGFVPLVGAILLIVWFCQRGTIGENLYGIDPLDGVEIDHGVRYGPSTSDLDKLERLADLHGRGILNDAEYDAQKATILR